jgi:4-diphosphocytidyl-2-C-methyl-D-erythritol kinase
VVIFSNCKINLGLQVIAKRKDGYHDLSTCFYPIPFNDVLEIVKADSFQFQSSGITIYSTLENNLIVKAYHLLLQDFPQIKNVHIHLLKNIPIGAGLGGGSANATYTLVLLAQLFNLPLSQTQLVNYASQLGSDCAFFVYNQPCMASGRGEILNPFALDLKGKYILLVLPNEHVSTKQAFAHITPKAPIKQLENVLQQPIATWQTDLINDFEYSVFKQFPTLKIIKENLYQQHALYAAMSGSGSTVFGIYPNENAALTAAQNFSNYTTKVLPL